MKASNFVELLRFPGSPKTVKSALAADIMDDLIKQGEALEAQVASLTIQRDAAEALVRGTRDAWAEDSRWHLTMAAVFRADRDAAQQMCW